MAVGASSIVSIPNVLARFRIIVVSLKNGCPGSYPQSLYVSPRQAVTVPTIASERLRAREKFFEANGDLGVILPGEMLNRVQHPTIRHAPTVIHFALREQDA